MFSIFALDPGCFCGCTCGACDHSAGLTADCNFSRDCDPTCRRSRVRIHAPAGLDLEPADTQPPVWAAIREAHAAPLAGAVERVVDPRDLGDDGQVVRRRSGVREGVRIACVERTANGWGVWSLAVLTPSGEVAARHTYARKIDQERG